VHAAAVRSLVLRARNAGLDPARIQRLTGVPPRSQRRIVHEEAISTMGEPGFRDKPGPRRPSELAPALRQQIDAFLAAEPAMKGAELLRRLRSEHAYQAGKDPVYRYLKSARPPRVAPAPLVRFEGVAGEFAQHDFGSLTVTYTDGTREKLTFYAGRLKYSRALHVCLVEDESAEAFLRGMEGFAAALGGLPLINVIDNTKAAVIKRHKDPATGQERIEYHAHFAAFLQEVGVFAEPTYPYSGNQKGCVESLVKFVKGAFLLARSFRNRADLLAQLAEWLQYTNHERPCDATGETPAVRLAAEQPYLRSLPFGAAGYGLAYPAIVGREARVRCRGYAYSTPAGWIGQPVVVRVHAEQVVLHHHQEQVIHPRVPENGRYSLLPEHRAALFVKPRGELMAKRQILMDLGPDAERFFTVLVHRRPQTWRGHDLPVLWNLFEQHGAARLTAAFAYCLAQGAIGGEYLSAWLLEVAQ
jgi:transposase